ncbi:MAG: transcriptional regulator [Methanosarcinales archaeon]|nr:transcriptional regulator [Methanosarcinales archaeon]
MNKELLTLRVIEILTRAGFMLSDRCNTRPRSFDLAARNNRSLLLLRTLSNIDSLNAAAAHEMRSLSDHLNGKPLIIGSKSRSRMLEDGVTYFRHGIPSINPATLHDCLIEGVPPLVYAAPGGLCIHIDGERLRSIRTEKKISLGELATKLGISRRTISRYEGGGMDASIDVALRLEEILDVELICPVRIFSSTMDDKIRRDDPRAAQRDDQKDHQRDDRMDNKDEVSLLLAPLGFIVFPAKQAPFNAISDDDAHNTMLTGINTYNRTMVRNAHLMSSISCVAGTRSLYIVKGSCRHTHIDGTVLIKESELEKVSDHDDVIQLIQERSTDKGS